MTAPLLTVVLALQADTVQHPRPLMAIGQTIAINTFVNRVDALLFQEAWARSGTRAWSRNLKLGWEWD